MRVISGSARGRRLKRVPGDTTRPIMDRVKENLFNIMAGYVPEARWLDLFGGTGSVGIEALSRGAKQVVFLDNARRAVQTIQENLRHTGLADRAQVQQINAFLFLTEYRDEPFDVIYVAPPQFAGLWRKALEQVDARASDLLLPDGEVVVQIAPKEDEPVGLVNLVERDRRRYGSTLLLFYGHDAHEETPIST